VLNNWKAVFRIVFHNAAVMLEFIFSRLSSTFIFKGILAIQSNQSPNLMSKEFASLFEISQCVKGKADKSLSQKIYNLKSSSFFWLVGNRINWSRKKWWPKDQILMVFKKTYHFWSITKTVRLRKASTRNNFSMRKCVTIRHPLLIGLLVTPTIHNRKNCYKFRKCCGLW